MQSKICHESHQSYHDVGAFGSAHCNHGRAVVDSHLAGEEGRSRSKGTNCPTQRDNEDRKKALHIYCFGYKSVLEKGQNCNCKTIQMAQGIITFTDIIRKDSYLGGFYT